MFTWTAAAPNPSNLSWALCTSFEIQYFTCSATFCSRPCPEDATALVSALPTEAPEALTPAPDTAGTSTAAGSALAPPRLGAFTPSSDSDRLATKLVTAAACVKPSDTGNDKDSCVTSR